MSETLAIRDEAHRIDPERLSEILERVRYETNVPGVAAAVWDGEAVATAHSGVATIGGTAPLSERSHFQVSCLMKMLLAITVLERVARGKLDLEMPIVDVLTELDKPDARAIRVRHLLGHCSGYRGVDVTNASIKWNFTWTRLIEHFARNSQSFSPGTVFNYEHTEHVLLGEILQRTAERDLCELVREEVEIPLGITLRFGKARQEAVREVGQHVFSLERGFVPVAVPAFCAFWNASLPDATISLVHALRIVQALANGGNGGPLTASTIHNLQADVISLPPQAASGPECERLPVAFTLGCGRYRNGLLGHNGSTMGQTCGVRYDPSRAFAIAVGVNAWVPHARDLVVQRVYDATSSQIPIDRPHPGDRMHARLTEIIRDVPLAQVSGEYLGSYHGKIVVHIEDGAIHLACGTTSRPNAIIVARRDPTRDDHYNICGTGACSLAFVAEPETGRPMLFLGVHAYKKV